MKTNVVKWKPRTHFEQVPVAVVKRIAGGEGAVAVAPAPDNLVAMETARRFCPGCGQLLDWIERNRIEQRELDYYHRCLRGCGLYCYDLTARSWIKLA
jgi:hypothetical protein